MSYKNVLIEEILSVINKYTDEKTHIIDPRVVAVEVCKNHENELTGSAEFSKFNNYTNVRREVTRIMGKKYDNVRDEDPNQLQMPGFHYLQTHYPVDRDGIKLVSVYEMSKEEIYQKAESYRKNARSLNAHADELIRFDDTENSKAV